MGKRFKEFIIALSVGKPTRNSLYDELTKDMENVDKTIMSKKKAKEEEAR